VLKPTLRESCNQELKGKAWKRPHVKNQVKNRDHKCIHFPLGWGKPTNRKTKTNASGSQQLWIKPQDLVGSGLNRTNSPYPLNRKG